MDNLTIQMLPEPHTEYCALCGDRTLASAGPCLCLADCPELVCRECGKKHAPHLLALLELGQVANRVGRVCDHMLVPPMEALLALARAAEDFLHSAPSRKLLKKAS